MYSSILLPRQWPRLACVCRLSTAVEGQKLPQSRGSSDGISPPPRIRRGPTVILEALATTVGPDPTAAHYKYHDDPYLIPLSNFRKRAYALSAEAGRRAAAWVRDNHGDLFTTRVWDPPGKKITPHFNAEPNIAAYAPKPIYTSESKVTEKDLEYTIENALMEDSIQIFQLLGGVEGVSDELKLKFLQLLCFYNEKEPDSMEWLEERWFSANSKERHSTTWKLGSLAETIFTAMEPKTSEAYCAIIQGMAKYYQAERAHALAAEAAARGLRLSADVFAALLGCIGFLREGTALRVEALQATLADMNAQGISPSAATLAACLRSVSAWGGGAALQTLALQLVAEFRALGVTPTLAAYYYVLCVFCRERGPRIDVLSSILTELEARDRLEAVDPADTNFFITAMGVCSDHLQDFELAERVHSLLLRGDNYRLVGDAYKESIYYRHYVTAACRYAPFERTTALLDSLVPNVYVPEPSVMEEIIRTLSAAGAGARLADAWPLLVVSGHATRARLVDALVAAAHACAAFQDIDVQERLRLVAGEVLKYGEVREEEAAKMRAPPQKLSASTLALIADLCSTGATDHWLTVSGAVRRLRREEASGLVARPELLADVAERAARAGHPDVAASAVSYLAECGFPEAAAGSARALAATLNRSEAEVAELLARPAAAAAAAALAPHAAQLVDAYHLATSGSSGRQDSSSSSDSDSSSDDE